MAQDGILQWANTIRFSMANDPGRKYFHDQIQSHGFLFLRSYLDDIMTGGRQDPLIELLKTPGRNRNSPRKQRAPIATSKLKTTSTILLEDEIIESKENGLITDFQSSLLQVTASSDKPACSTPRHSPAPTSRAPFSPKKNVDLIADDLFYQESSADTIPPLPESPELPIEDISFHRPEQQDLFIIEEDDETAERSRMSISEVDPRTSPSRDVIPHSPPPAADKPISIISFQHSMRMERSTAAETEESQVTSATHRRSSLESKYLTASASSQPDIAQAAPAVPSKVLTMDSILASRTDTIVPLNDEETETMHGLKQKPVPPLPNNPLRKSVRAPREPSVQPVTPGTGLGGKRTSWLTKLREAKALEPPKAAAPPEVQPSSSTSGVGKASDSTNHMKRKSSEMLEELDTNHKQAKSQPTFKDDHDHVEKKSKTGEGEAVSNYAHDENITAPSPSVPQRARTPAATEPEEELPLQFMMKTVKDLGSRAYKSSGKSLGGAAIVSALAEAKAAAQARVAEKEFTMGLGPPAKPPSERHEEMEEEMEIVPQADSSRKASSDAKPRRKKSSTQPPAAIEVPEKPAPSSKPISNHPQPMASVFSGPVFTAPTKSKVQAPSTNATTKTSFASAAMSVGLSPRLEPLPKKNAKPITAQSTMESIASDSVFDRPDYDDVPAWMPETQDTEYSQGYELDIQHGNMDLDDDDSMMMDEGVDLNNIWTFGKAGDDTWSSQPTQSHKTDTGASMMRKILEEKAAEEEAAARQQDEQELQYDGAMTGTYDREVIIIDEETRAFGEIQDPDSDPAEPSIRLVKQQTTQTLSQSQASTSSGSSQETSQAPVSFFGQAQKLVSSMLSGTKKGKPEVKSLQLAAAAAKKQQEERDKKAARLKEMENRRNLAMQRKAEEEKTRLLEEEKKIKEEGERRKREREEQTDKRPIFKPQTKRDDDTTKKRKVAVEEKKTELKKTASKTGLNLAGSSKPTKPALKNANTTPAHHTTGLPSAGSSSSKTTKPPASGTKGKSKLGAKIPSSDEEVRPKTVKMAPAPRPPTTPAPAQLPPTESIELPDINSEYSDSEDEDRKRTFDPPEWAQSPELAQALQLQSRINPDDIFGSIRPLRMEEIFRSRTSRFRARTSSANWLGSDRLTAEEEREYVRRMGYR